MDNLQLSELAQKAKNGDMAAFEKIYIELSPDVYAIACEITKNKEESRDLVQDCFVAAIENISTLNEPEKIKKWLIRIAANKSRDYLKKKKPSVLTEEQYEIIDNIEDEDISAMPEESLETEERIEDVNEILGCLTEEKRLCLLLRYKYDMSYAEIAQELEITESAVKSRISRAKDDVEKEAEKRNKKGLPLFGIAPFGLVIFALKKSADITAASFAGSAAQTAAFTGVTAASQMGVAASTVASATTTATSVGTKVAAMSVTQKVVAGVAAASIATGSATVTTVVVKNKFEAREETTTAYVEEVTTAPDYGFENETVFIPAVAETESETSATSTRVNSTLANQSSTVLITNTTEKSTSAVSTKIASTTKKPTTAKATTTKKETTTQKVTTTKATTTKKESTTVKVTTTKAVTTTQASTTAATVAATTKSARATVTVTVWGESSSTTKTLYFEAGEKITATEIENRLSDEYGIEAIADNINVTAEAGGNYTATAYE